MQTESHNNSARKPRVCLVDDDEMILSLFSRVLQRTGCDVVTAKGPAAVNELLANSLIDVVISDLRMPTATDGEKLLVQIHERYPELEIWMMSSELGSDIRSHLINSGASQCIEKPFTAARICQLIDQLDIPNLEREPLGS